MSIVTRLIFLILLFFVGYFAFYSYGNISIARKVLENSERQKIDMLLGIVEPILGTNIGFGFYDSVESYMDGIHKSNEDLVGSKVTDMHGQSLYEKNFVLQKYANDKHFIYRKEAIKDPITLIPVAILELAYSSKNHDRLESQVEIFTFQSMLVLILLAAVLGWLLSESLKPLKKLSETVKQYDPDDPYFNITKRNAQDEIGVIQNALSEFVNKIKLHAENLANLNLTLEQKVQHRTAQLKHANEAKTIFLSNMTHEIRTPMNAVLGYAQLLEADSSLTDKQRKAVRTINASGEQLMELINDILDISKIEAGKMELVNTDFKIGEMMDSLYDLFEDAVHKKGIEWSVSVVPDTGVVVEADRGKLFRVLTNLIGNAVKFTNPGGKVTLSCVQNGNDSYRFEVADTGVGIREDEQKRIFKPFVQNEDGSRLGGTGLGLSIAKNSLALMGSSIKLDSIFGIGSRFYFDVVLPAQKYATQSTVSAKEVRDSFGQKASALKVLIVDDMVENREVLAQLLERIGLSCYLAKSGEESLKICEEESFDCIFMDIRMPGIGGVEATRRIRAKYKKVVVFAITASILYVKKSQQENGSSDPFDRVILKPFNIEQIYKMLEEFFGISASKSVAKPQIRHSDEDLSYTLDENLREEILVFSDFGQIAALKDALMRIPNTMMRDRLMHLAEEFDMSSISAILSKPSQG